jgi:hypothetical protein
MARCVTKHPTKELKMEKFSNFERSIAHSLKHMPGLKRRLKNGYLSVSALFFREKNFQTYLAPNLSLITPSQWANVDLNPSDWEEFYGYFGKSPWSNDGRWFVCHTQQRDQKSVFLVVYNQEKATRTILAETPCWTKQQGAMACWLNHEGQDAIIYNDLVAGQPGSVIVSPAGQRLAEYAYCFQENWTGTNSFFSINYQRLFMNGTEYGFPYPSCEKLPLAEDQDGIWIVDRSSGKGELFCSIEAVKKLDPTPDMDEANHEFNHLSCAPDGSKMVFIHRYRGKNGQVSRLISADLETQGLSVMTALSLSSHYCWLDSERLLIWGRDSDADSAGYYSVNVSENQLEAAGPDAFAQRPDGHPSLFDKYVITDSYPNRRLQQDLVLYDIETKQVETLGRFYHPLKFREANRIDLHPRWHPQGIAASIDAGFSGRRQCYILQIEDALKRQDTTLAQAALHNKAD